MTTVSKEEFWHNVMNTTRNVHPSPERDYTTWHDLRTQSVWGWVSKGYVTQTDPIEYKLVNPMPQAKEAI
jgi:hypothetical protein